MKLIHFFIGLTFLFMHSLHAAEPILNIGVNNFAPPFVMRGANNIYYGFDIVMMNHICKSLNRTCKFVPMAFSKLIQAVVNKEVDLAVGSITITAERTALVNFSLPYLPSLSSFVCLKTKIPKKFNLESLHNRTIGVERGSIFPQELLALGVKNAEIVYYETPANIMEGLHNEDIEFAIMDTPAAMFWDSLTSQITILGKPFTYGLGLGIAVNRENLALLNDINQAMMAYQKSLQFNKAYQKYIKYF